MRSDSLGEFLRARLALVTAGHEPLGAPRRAAPAADDATEQAWDAGLGDDDLGDDDLGDDDLGADDLIGAGRGPARGGREPASGGGVMGAGREPDGRSAAGESWLARVGAAARPGFERRHLLAVVAVGVLVTVVTAVLWWGGQPQTVPIPVAHAGESSASSAPTASATPTPSPTAPTVIVVHVAGAVQRPGIVKLPDGARVADAIEAAGGLRSDANPADLNLAAVLSDGAQVLIGTSKAPAGEVRGGGVAQQDGSATASPLGRKLNLNKATQAELEGLPGIGPVTAKAIIDWRTRSGGFTRVEELQEIEGIGPKTYAKLAELVEV